MSNLSAYPKLTGVITSTRSLSGSLSSESALSGSLTVPQSQGSSTLSPATSDTLGGIIVGDDLSITEEGRLSVLKASAVEEDNTRPITAAAVYTEIGNINALLGTI